MSGLDPEYVAHVRTLLVQANGDYRNPTVANAIQRLEEMTDQVGFRSALLGIGADASQNIGSRISALAFLKRITNSYWTMSSQSNRDPAELEARKEEREHIQSQLLELAFHTSPNVIADMIIEIIGCTLSGSIAEQWPSLFPDLLNVFASAHESFEGNLQANPRAAWQTADSSGFVKILSRGCSILSTCFAVLSRFAVRGRQILKEVVHMGLPQIVITLNSTFRTFISAVNASQEYTTKKSASLDQFYSLTQAIVNALVQISKVVYAIASSTHGGLAIFHAQMGPDQNSEHVANVLFAFIKEALPALDTIIEECTFPLTEEGIDVMKAVSHARGSLASVVLASIRASPMHFGHFLLPFLEMFFVTIERRAKTRDSRVTKEVVVELLNNTPESLRDQISGVSAEALNELRQAVTSVQGEDDDNDPDEAASEFIDALQSMDAEDNRCAKGTDMCTLQALHFITRVMNCIDYARALKGEAEEEKKEENFLTARLKLAAAFESNQSDQTDASGFDAENVAVVENAIQSFFTPERVGDLTDILLTSFMSTSSAQRAHWISDPENFIESQITGDTDEQSAATSLLSALASRRQDVVHQRLEERFSALVQAEEEMGGPASLLTTSPEAFISGGSRENLLTTSPQAAITRLQLDGVLLALSQELHTFDQEAPILGDLFNYLCSRISQYSMAAETIRSISENASQTLSLGQTPITTSGLYRSVTSLQHFIRRTQYLASAEDIFPIITLIGSLLQALESPDIVVRYAVVEALNDLFADVALSSTLTEYFEEEQGVTAQLIDAVASLVLSFTDVKLKSSVLKCLSAFTVVVGTAIANHSELMTDFIPRLWEMCADKRMRTLRSDLVDILESSVFGLKGYSQGLHESVLFPLIEIGLGIAESSDEGADSVLHDDVLELWAVVLENTIELPDRLLSYTKYLAHHLSQRGDNVPILMRILTAYARIDANRVLEFCGSELSQALLRIVLQECQSADGIPNEDSLSIVTSALEELCPLAPQHFAEYFGPFLVLAIQHARSFALLGPDAPQVLSSRQLMKNLSLICYILVRMPDVGVQFLSSLPNNSSVDQARPDTGDSAEVPQLIFSTLLQIMRPDEIPYYRKLFSVASVRVLPMLNSSVIVRELFYLYNTVLLADPAVEDQTEPPSEDTPDYLKVDEYRVSLGFSRDPLYMQPFTEVLSNEMYEDVAKSVLETCESYKIDRLAGVFGIEV